MSNMSRNHKDNVFCLLYRERKNLLSLYNAVNGTSYENEEELEVVTLEKALCVKIKNDAAFVIDATLNLYEHQSSITQNMPLRDLYYVTEELQRIAPPNTLYRRKMVKIPAPHFITFYNGTEPQPERSVYRLSDMYEKNSGEPELELKVMILNINSGYNESLKENCESLKGYMHFVEKVRDKKAVGIEIREAVSQAVEECISENILAEFFKENRKEIVEMSIWEFNQELHDQAMWEDGEADGLEKGEFIGIEKGELRKLISLVCKKIKKNKPLEKIAEDLEEEISAIEPIYHIVKESALDYDIDKIYARLAAAGLVR